MRLTTPGALRSQRHHPWAVLPSASVYTGNYTDCRIHACSDPAHSGVTVKGNVQVAPISTRKAKDLDNTGPLTFYRVTWPTAA